MPKLIWCSGPYSAAKLVSADHKISVKITTFEASDISELIVCETVIFVQGISFREAKRIFGLVHILEEILATSTVPTSTVPAEVHPRVVVLFVLNRKAPQ